MELAECTTVDQLERAAFEAQLAGEFAPVEVPVTHTHVPGVYYREVVMPAGAIVIGKKHLGRHLNFVLEGSALVSMNGEMFQIQAPARFISEPGTRKVLLILEDCRFGTVHPNPDDCEDVPTLEARYVEESPAFKEFAPAIEELKRAAAELAAFESLNYELR